MTTCLMTTIIMAFILGVLLKIKRLQAQMRGEK